MATTTEGPGPSDEGKGVVDTGSVASARTTPDQNDGPQSTLWSGSWRSALRSGLGWVKDNPAPLLLILGGLAYLVGYLEVTAFAGELGIQASVLGLDYRDHVLLSLTYFLLLVTWTLAAAAGVWLIWRLKRKHQLLVSNVLWLLAIASLLFLWLILQNELQVGVLWQVAAAMGLVAVGSMAYFDSYLNPTPEPDQRSAPAEDTAGEGDAHTKTIPLRKKLKDAGIRLLIGVMVVAFFAVLLWALLGPAVNDSKNYAKDLIKPGESEAGTLWTPLALVIRPGQVLVYNNTHNETPAHIQIKDGEQATLVSDTNGKAVLIHDGQVRVENSTKLTFISKPEEPQHEEPDEEPDEDEPEQPTPTPE